MEQTCPSWIDRLWMAGRVSDYEVGCERADRDMHVPAHWIVVGALVVAGLGILMGFKATRQKDSGT